MKRWVKATLGVVGGLVVLGVLASMAGNDPAPSESTGDPREGEGAAGEPQSDASDCTGDRNCAALSVARADRQACVSEYLCADSGMEYLVTRVRVENTGVTPVETNPFYFKAHAGGVGYGVDGATFGADGGMQSVSLARGASHEGVLVFKVPAGADVDEVCFEPPTFAFGGQPRYCAPLTR